jgi:phosphoribosylaminoimidazolecarboxamide formyltransferase/IMP cyclohydrolase
MTINVVKKIDNLVEIRNILISVSDKTGLKKFVNQLLKINPGLIIYSTGGTHDHIQTFLGDKSIHVSNRSATIPGSPKPRADWSKHWISRFISVC